MQLYSQIARPSAAVAAAAVVVVRPSLIRKDPPSVAAVAVPVRLTSRRPVEAEMSLSWSIQINPRLGELGMRPGHYQKAPLPAGAGMLRFQIWIRLSEAVRTRRQTTLQTVAAEMPGLPERLYFQTIHRLLGAGLYHFHCIMG